MSRGNSNRRARRQRPKLAACSSSADCSTDTASAVADLATPVATVSGVGTYQDRARRGRPPGSKNVDYSTVVEEVPACCPKCRSTDLRAVPDSKVIERDISGVLPTGFRYVGVLWSRRRCGKCRQCVTVRTYLPSVEN